MATAVETTNVTILSVSAALPATHDSTGFAALSYTAVSDVVDLGDFGATFNEVTHTPLNDGIVQKFKGSRNDGTCAVKLGRDSDDAGQTLLRAASLVYADYSFKVLFQGGSISYFRAKVMGYTTDVGGVDKIVGSTVNLAINKTIVEVAA